jgi:hypothetical protein
MTVGGWTGRAAGLETGEAAGLREGVGIGVELSELLTCSSVRRGGEGGEGGEGASVS